MTAYVNTGRLLPTYVAVSASRGILISSDAITWTLSTTPRPPFVSAWKSVAHGDGKFVIMPSGSSTLTFTDGTTWTQGTLPVSSSNWNSIAYGNGRFVSVVESTQISASSTDGIAWTRGTLPVSLSWNSIAFGNNRFVCSGLLFSSNFVSASSTDGITWTQGTFPASAFNWSVTYGNGIFVALGNYLPVPAAYSTNGITWTQGTFYNSSSSTSFKVAYGNGIFFAVGTNTTPPPAAISTNGITWTQSTIPSVFYRALTYGNGEFVAISEYPDNSFYVVSTNGITWTQRTLPTNSLYITGIAYGEKNPWEKFDPKTKVGGIWKDVDDAYTKVNGEWKRWFLRGGVRDNLFIQSTTTPTTYPSVRGLAPFPGGGFIVVDVNETASYFNGSTPVTHKRILKFNSDGTIDTQWTNNASSALTTLGKTATSVVYSNGGTFVSSEGKSYIPLTTSPGIMRLNQDGTLDTSFMSAIGTGWSGPGYTFDAGNGKVFVTSSSTSWNGGGVNTSRLVRLNSDGTRDQSFNNSSYSISSTILTNLEVSSSGKIYLVSQGEFYNNTNGTLWSYHAVRLNSDGSIDTSFNPSWIISGSHMFDIHEYASGRVLIGGKNGIRMTNYSGSIDSTWNGGLSPVSTQDCRQLYDLKNGLVAVVLNGSIAWSGTSYLTSFYVINEDGSVNDSWMTNMGGTGNPNAFGSPVVVTETLGNEFIVGGNFRSWFTNLYDAGITVMGNGIP